MEIARRGRYLWANSGTTRWVNHLQNILRLGPWTVYLTNGCRTDWLHCVRLTERRFENATIDLWYGRCDSTALSIALGKRYRWGLVCKRKAMMLRLVLLGEGWCESFTSYSASWSTGRLSISQRLGTADAVEFIFPNCHTITWAERNPKRNWK